MAEHVHRWLDVTTFDQASHGYEESACTCGATKLEVAYPPMPKAGSTVLPVPSVAQVNDHEDLTDDANEADARWSAVDKNACPFCGPDGTVTRQHCPLDHGDENDDADF